MRVRFVSTAPQRELHNAEHGSSLIHLKNQSQPCVFPTVPEPSRAYRTGPPALRRSRVLVYLPPHCGPKFPPTGVAGLGHCRERPLRRRSNARKNFHHCSQAGRLCAFLRSGRKRTGIDLGEAEGGLCAFPATSPQAGLGSALPVCCPVLYLGDWPSEIGLAPTPPWTPASWASCSPRPGR